MVLAAGWWGFSALGEAQEGEGPAVASESRPEPAGWVVLRRSGGRLAVERALSPPVATLTGSVGASRSNGLVAVGREQWVEPAADPRRSLQWHVDTLGLDDLPPGIDGSGVTVAVIDTAIAMGHEDLAPFVQGFDAIENRLLDPVEWQVALDRVGEPIDHGSHVAGIVGAVADNGVGGVGNAPGASLMPVRVLGGDGGLLSDLVQGMLWAIDHDADVLNLSLVSWDDSPVLRAAVAEAEAAGVVMVAAAGNQGLAGSPVVYPAAYSTVIGVGAVQSDLTRAPWSSQGLQVNIAAPGSMIDSTGGGSVDSYLTMSGTSMATPQVAAAAALVLQADRSLTPAEVRDLLTDTADDLGLPGVDESYGAGLVDPVEAVGRLVPPIEPVEPPPAPLQVMASFVAGEVLVAWELSADGVEAVEVLRDGVIVARLDPAITEYRDATPRRGGSSVYEVVAVGPGGRTGTRLVVEIPPVETRYWVVTDRGRVLPFGGADELSPPEVILFDFGTDNGVVGGAPTPTGSGYWLVDRRGRVVVFGDAGHQGDLRDLVLNRPVVGMAVSPTGRGYWLVASDGGVFAFGDARFFGSTGGMILNRPIVDMAVSPTGDGYWLVASDGGVFAFGDARFLGSTGSIVLNEPMVSMAAGSEGYWLVASDGGVFTFGVPFHGSIPGLVTGTSAVVDGRRIRSIDGGAGYLVLSGDGALYGFGSAADVSVAGAQLQEGETAVDLLMVQF